MTAQHPHSPFKQGEGLLLAGLEGIVVRPSIINHLVEPKGMGLAPVTRTPERGSIDIPTSTMFCSFCVCLVYNANARKLP